MPATMVIALKHKVSIKVGKQQRGETRTHINLNAYNTDKSLEKKSR